jgi:excisionase family DNA binding protein
MLGVSERTIWRMIADGQLAAVRFRHCTRISMEQIQNILKGGGKAGAL